MCLKVSFFACFLPKGVDEQGIGNQSMSSIATVYLLILGLK